MSLYPAFSWVVAHKWTAFNFLIFFCIVGLLINYGNHVGTLPAPGHMLGQGRIVEVERHVHKIGIGLVIG